MKSFNGVAVSEPVSDGFGEIADANHFGDAVVVDAAGFELIQRPIRSRRAAATAVHANGAAPGAPPSPPPASHANNRSLSPDTAPPVGAAVIAGAAAAAGGAALAGAGTTTLVAAAGGVAATRECVRADARSGTTVAGGSLWPDATPSIPECAAAPATDAAPPLDATAVADGGGLAGAGCGIAVGALLGCCGGSTTVAGAGAAPPRTTGSASEAADPTPEREPTPLPAVPPVLAELVDPDRSLLLAPP
ncbi:MAG: hypothetical protein U0R66_12455 [Mycobacterium sp.]